MIPVARATCRREMSAKTRDRLSRVVSFAAILTGWLAVLATALGQPAKSEPARNDLLTAIVMAGSVDNEFKVQLTNANSWSAVRGLKLSARGTRRYIENLRFEPSQPPDLPANSSSEIIVRFDISQDVPEQGATEELVLDVSAQEGFLDYPKLTLRIGIETPETSLHIVPLVTGLPKAEALRKIRSAGLKATTEKAKKPPGDPDAAGTVVSQGIAAGKIVKAQTVVPLIVFPDAIPLVPIPDVVGMKSDDASRLILQAGLKARVTELGAPPTREEADLVTKSEPAAGEMVETGSTVVLHAYGPFRGGVAGAGWRQPWRGEIKLTRIVINGNTLTVAAAIRTFAGPGRKKKDDDDDDTSLITLPIDIVDAIGEAIAEAVMAGIRAGLGILGDGLPLSLTFNLDQGGFRLAVPGASTSVDQANEYGAFLPLFILHGPHALHTEWSDSSPEGSARISCTFSASPDWTRIGIDLVLSGSSSGGDTDPNEIHSVELRLTGSLEPGLYDAATYQADVTRIIMSGLEKYAPELLKELQ